MSDLYLFEVDIKDRYFSLTGQWLAGDRLRRVGRLPTAWKQRIADELRSAPQVPQSARDRADAIVLRIVAEYEETRQH